MQIPPFQTCLHKAHTAKCRQGFRGHQLAKAAGLGHEVYSRLLHDGKRAPAWKTVYRLLVGAWLPLEFFFPPGLILEAAERIHQEKSK